VWLAAQTVPELPVEATDPAALGDGERRSVSADPRDPIGHHLVRFQGKGATALVERAVLTRVGNIEEGKSGLELGEQKPPADLVEAVPELRRYLELIRVVRHRMGLNEGAGKGAGFHRSPRVARATVRSGLHASGHTQDRGSDDVVVHYRGVPLDAGMNCALGVPGPNR